MAGFLVLPGCAGDPTVYGPCQPSEYGSPACPYPEAGTGDAGDGGDGGGGSGGGGTGGGGTGGGEESACAGDCIPPAPLGWFGPALLWYGPPDQAPGCPAEAPNPGYKGFADLAPAPFACAACLCDPPASASCELPLGWSAHTAAAYQAPGCPAEAPNPGYKGFADLAPAPFACAACLCDPPASASCELPLGWSAHTAAACTAGGPGSVETAFAAPDGWDGACTAASAIPAGQDCGGQPCVQSLSVEAPAVLVTAACTPRVDEPPPPAREDPWQTRALACLPGAYTECPDDRSTCMPSPGEPGAPPPGGFLTCIFHEGDVTCESPYLDRHVFYGGAEDTRGCSACGCGAPEGASCTIMASVYSDGACAETLVSAVVSSTTPFCGVTPPGVALGSKSAEVVAVDPGACAPSGGEPTGELLPAEPSTFCCLA
ncbi:hypothetical protein SCE1572_23195 [Sorangium cellulosum So0157-2]|uniref:Uncharacterized protein n=2 Tax=Sorangium cellulosum TaxID=56 RepID=S4XV80_SORCE|nr:hypothetical protein SCE1572_23195 [Sorangium cellulosum So0157-2]